MGRLKDFMDLTDEMGMTEEEAFDSVNDDLQIALDELIRLRAQLASARGVIRPFAQLYLDDPEWVDRHIEAFEDHRKIATALGSLRFQDFRDAARWLRENPEQEK